MKSRDFANMQLTTTPSPVRSGRNPAFYPILVMSNERIESMSDIVKNYPKGCFIREPMDRHKHSIPGIYDVMPSIGDRRLARFRWHEDHGWLEELSPVWTVNGDYATVLAVAQIAELEDQGIMNIATVMRFGAQLAALLMGNADIAIRADVLTLLNKITLRSAAIAGRVEVEDGIIKLSL